MIEKSDNAFRTISEVADELDLPQHVLRFWETKFRQISPIKRGGGRRYYRPQDVELIRRIKSLLHTEGYTIKGVQRMLGQGGLHKLPEVPVAPARPELGAELELEVGAEAEGESGRAMSANMAEIAATLSELEQIRDLLKKSVA